jgi:uncharacterized protein (TIGR00375 family)
MKVIADLHIHSRYARACSRDLIPGNLGLWADKKGISIVGTGDFTHPGWLADLENSLVETKPGLYSLRDSPAKALFMLTSEVASIYKLGDKVRRVHNLIFAPSIDVVKKLNVALVARGVNLKSDGRPIMGVKCDELLKICKDVDERIELVPAHAWTPHFGVFGSLSGFDLLSEAFGDQAKHIFAIETGLSSDPKMNWQVSTLDDISLISNSDAHSLRKLGREANVFEIPETDLSYDAVIRTIRERDPKRFLYTIEFFPEEGKYHLDGHRDHSYSSWPEETKKNNGICPICGKKLLRGVMHRVDDLGDREYGFIPERSIPFKSIIPLEEIIAETFGVGTSSKKVLAMYEAMVAKHSEFDILLEIPESEIAVISDVPIAQSIVRVRDGKVHIEPGYDGVFGKIQIYSPKEREKLSLKPKQSPLF